MMRVMIAVTLWTVTAAALAQETGGQAGALQEPKPAATQPATTQPATTQPLVTQPAESFVYVRFETTAGDFVLELNAAKAPISVENFLAYVDSGYYAGTIFHRVMSDFMIQGGGFLPDFKEKTEGLRPPIKNEWKNGLKNKRGAVAMARTAEWDSATSQFFINVVDNPKLDEPRDGAAYAVFGRVVAGMDTVDRIRTAETKVDLAINPRGEKSVPLQPVVVRAAGRISAEEGREHARKTDEAARQAAAEAKAALEKQLQELVAKVEQETGRKVEKTASGLMHVLLKEGDGPKPELTDMLEAHYTGWLLDGTKFDSSYDRNQPLHFSLRGGVIKGWLEGVALMKVGEKRKFIIPPELGFRDEIRPGIPPNSTLVFDIELLSAKAGQSPPGK